MDNHRIISALVWEARRRGLSYGQLAARLLPGEAEKICKEYIKARAAARVEQKKAKKAMEAGRRALTVKPYRAKSFSERDARRLYREGKNDSQIGRELGTSPQNIFNWRKRMKLPAVVPPGRKGTAASE